ncbi:MAG TPA: hypothetical protein VMG32_13385 [Anaeromyxobacteraceae bacterium]|nr:hypothetical protein [Anaeromyxobacteraceae bacterium]
MPDGSQEREEGREAGAPRSARTLRERACLELHFPASTRPLSVDGVKGYLFPLETELGDRFELFAWFDGSAYQVRVVHPALEGLGPHAVHLFPDRRICFGHRDGGGVATLEEAHARSALWANGMSAYLRGARFPF